MAREKKKLGGFDNVLFVRVSDNLSAAVERAAEHELVSLSAYVRGALAQRLRRDGFDPQQGAHA